MITKTVLCVKCQLFLAMMGVIAAVVILLGYPFYADATWKDTSEIEIRPTPRIDARWIIGMECNMNVTMYENETTIAVKGKK